MWACTNTRSQFCHVDVLYMWAVASSACCRLCMHVHLAGLGVDGLWFKHHQSCSATYLSDHQRKSGMFGWSNTWDGWVRVSHAVLCCTLFEDFP